MAFEVPRDPGPQVGLPVLPAYRPRPILPDEAFGGGPLLAGALREGAGVGNQAYEMGRRRVAQEHEARYNEADAELVGAETRLRSAIDQARLGDAPAGVERALKDFDTSTGKLGQGIQDPQLRRRFEIARSLRRGALEAFGTKHKERELEAFDTSTLKARLKGEREAAIASMSGDEKTDDPLRLALAVDVQGDAIRKYGERYRLPKETVDRWVLEEESAVHAGVLGRMSRAGRHARAKEYLEANRKGMVDEDLSRAEGHVAAGSRLGEAQQLSDRIFKETKTEDLGRKAIRELRNLEPEVRQLTERLFEGRWYDQRRFEAERYEALKGEVVEAILGQDRPGNTAMEVVGPDRWDRLKATEKTQADALFQRMRRRAEPDMEKGGWSAWTRWTGMSPAAQAKISDQAMELEWRTVLSDQFYSAALQDRAQARAAAERSSGAGLSELGGWEGNVKDALRVNGIITGDSGPKNAAEAKAAAIAELQIKSRIWAFEEQNKRKATPKERTEILTAALKDQVVRRVEYNPMIQLAEGLRGGKDHGYEKVSRLRAVGEGMKDIVVPIEKIPSPSREKYANLLKGRGRVVSDEKIERLAGAIDLDNLDLFEAILSEED